MPSSRDDVEGCAGNRSLEPRADPEWNHPIMLSPDDGDRDANAGELLAERVCFVGGQRPYVCDERFTSVDAREWTKVVIERVRGAGRVGVAATEVAP